MRCARICLYALKTTTKNLYSALQPDCGRVCGDDSHLVYEIATRWVCHAAASRSGQSPRILAAMVAAAEIAPVIARCTPDEKNGSIKAVRAVST